MPILNRRFILPALIACMPVVAAIVSAPRIFDRFHSARPDMRIVVDLSERRLRVVEGGEVVHTYGVAVGSRKHPTPTGSYWTGRIQWNPRWVPPPRKWAAKLHPRGPHDPRNPMQGVKIYFREPWYFIHGTNDPGSIGTAASHGCIRMRVADARSLARRISKHGSVQLVIRA